MVSSLRNTLIVAMMHADDRTGPIANTTESYPTRVYTDIWTPAASFAHVSQPDVLSGFTENLMQWPCGR
jgi:hypothetical protein